MTKAMEPKLSITLARLAVGVAIMLLAASASHAQDARNFWVLNNTGATITELYVAPHNERAWRANTLGGDVILPGQGTVLSFDNVPKSSCVMDFKLVFEDGSVQDYVQGRNVCQLQAVQFNEDTLVGLALK